MKKIMLVMAASVLALLFSAFTPQQSALGTFYYEDDEGETQEWIGDPCPTQETPICMVTVGGKRVRLFTDFALSNPVPGPGLP